ncbi:hypothetical protein LJC58_01880 [Lachnospiraceae bacterium OttesenSCG-928-D06]|nr:hypothetical protein [Lachnospiraceae bacterium OttesenSCG-928-D06]
MRSRKVWLGLILVLLLQSNASNVYADINTTHMLEEDSTLVFDLDYSDIPTTASEYDDSYESTTRNSFIRSCSASLSINGSTAKGTGTCSKYANVSDDISIYIYLQKKSGNSWITIDDTSSSFSNTTGSLTLTTTGIDRGTYRIKVSCWVAGENIIVNSSSKTY